MEKVPTRVFSWLKALTSVFTFKKLLRHYAKWALALALKGIVADFNQEKALVGAFSVIIHHRRLIVNSTSQDYVPAPALPAAAVRSSSV